MDKLLLTTGIKTNYTTIVDKLQQYARSNYSGMYHSLFETLGVLENIEETSLKVYWEGQNVVIYPGKGVTPSLDVIDLTSKLLIPSDDCYIDNVSHGLYLVCSGVAGLPDDIVNGESYATTVKQLATVYRDEYVPMWDYTGASGIYLSDITFYSGAGPEPLVEDKRTFLTLSTAMLPTNVANLSYDLTQTFDSEISASGLSIYSGGDEVTLTYEALSLLANSITSLEKLVAPKNFIISSVSPEGDPKEITIILKWDWDTVLGGGRSVYTALEDNQFKVTNSLTWGTDVLAGCYLRCTAGDYKITANTGEILTVAPMGAALPIEQINLTATNPGKIRSSISGYSTLTLSPKDIAGHTDYDEVKRITVSHEIQQTSISIRSNTYWDIEITNSAQYKHSDATLLAAGSVMMPSKFQTPYRYESPFYAKAPYLASAGAVAATCSDNQLKITLNGWALADKIELCATSDATGVDFDVIRQKKEYLVPNEQGVTLFDWAITAAGNYNIKARPLINSNPVADPVSVTVEGIFNGLLPGERSISFDVNLFTFKFVPILEGDYYLISGVMTTPYNGSNAMTFNSPSHFGLVTGSISPGAEDNYVLYCGKTIGGTPFVKSKESLTSGVTYGINIDQVGRTVYRTLLPYNARVETVTISYGCAESWLPDNLYLRWGQGYLVNDDGMGVFDTLRVKDKTKVSSLEILENRGDRYITFDLYTDDAARLSANYASFTGTITFHYLPL